MSDFRNNYQNGDIVESVSESESASVSRASEGEAGMADLSDSAAVDGVVSGLFPAAVSFTGSDLFMDKGGIGLIIRLTGKDSSAFSTVS